MKITKRELRQIIKEERALLRKKYSILTTRQLKRIIKEVLLLEEPSDYYKDYKSGSISYAEYKQLVRDYENKASSSPPQPRNRPVNHTPSTKDKNTDFMGREIKWTGTAKELEARVHKYLIDIRFYNSYDHVARVNPMQRPSGPDAHPDGGYTSAIPKVIQSAIASGDIDWANWHEIEPTYKKIDRSIN
jgi:hypothetical protein